MTLFFSTFFFFFFSLIISKIFNSLNFLSTNKTKKQKKKLLFLFLCKYMLTFLICNNFFTLL
ncbi:hypothetical protein C1646_88803 [Rhizophagus diaphanus]|nr:hypothetical protein C1646_88803 [Rhizophagus diaphanus] [Rhizophagus sp. MUCL 43196]